MQNRSVKLKLWLGMFIFNMMLPRSRPLQTFSKLITHSGYACFDTITYCMFYSPAMQGINVRCISLLLRAKPTLILKPAGKSSLNGIQYYSLRVHLAD